MTAPATDIVEAAGAAISDGYEIELVPVSDYVTVNNMLAAGDIDANFSQHEPYMQEFNEKNGASLEAVQPIYNFVIAFYSKTLTDIDQLPDGATVAIPNDSSNTARALKLLAASLSAGPQTEGKLARDVERLLAEQKATLRRLEDQFREALRDSDLFGRATPGDIPTQRPHGNPTGAPAPEGPTSTSGPPTGGEDRI